MPEAPRGYRWKVKLDSERITVDLVHDPHEYMRARQRAFWVYRGDVSAGAVEGMAQKILDRLARAKELEQELGVPVEWS